MKRAVRSSLPWLAAALLAMVDVACGSPRADGARALPVAVTVPPQAWLVRSIGGDRVDVAVLLPPGTSPHTYEPTPQQVARLSDARLVVEVGHPSFLFERRLLDALLAREPKPLVVDMSRRATLLRDEDAGGETDPHLWLSPAVMRAAAADVTEALATLDPAAAATYRSRLPSVQAEIDAVDRDLRRTFAGDAGRRFLVYHPAWGYLAHEYGLQQVAIEAHGKEPSARRLVELVDAARRDHVDRVFVQLGTYDRPARAIADELGARLVTVDPMAEDWPGNLRRVAAEIAGALRG
jgi:zinc transport system substrate-binding protein